MWQKEKKSLDKTSWPRVSGTWMAGPPSAARPQVAATFLQCQILNCTSHLSFQGWHSTTSQPPPYQPQSFSPQTVLITSSLKPSSLSFIRHLQVLLFPVYPGGTWPCQPHGPLLFKHWAPPSKMLWFHLFSQVGWEKLWARPSSLLSSPPLPSCVLVWGRSVPDSWEERTNMQKSWPRVSKSACT